MSQNIFFYFRKHKEPKSLSINDRSNLSVSCINCVMVLSINCCLMSNMPLGQDVTYSNIDIVRGLRQLAFICIKFVYVNKKIFFYLLC